MQYFGFGMKQVPLKKYSKDLASLFYSFKEISKILIFKLRLHQPELIQTITISAAVVMLIHYGLYAMLPSAIN